MHLDGLLGHPVGPLRFPRRSKGVQGRPGSSFLSIWGAMLAHFGEHVGQYVAYVCDDFLIDYDCFVGGIGTCFGNSSRPFGLPKHRQAHSKHR